jgi:hypothetical protein
LLYKELKRKKKKKSKDEIAAKSTNNYLEMADS